MYFALIPDQDTVSALTTLVDDPVEEFHLTLLFSPDRKTLIPPDEVKEIWDSADGHDAKVLCLRNLGPAGRLVWALQLDPAPWLKAVRTACEALLDRLGIPWSKEWDFNPHVTVCKRPGIALTRELPAALSFEGLELRY